ncbi:MAG TPA: response regulator transcription factor [Geminicoccaceae bacterium]|jgi:DNA-binding NarL/FixJ family response regulator|nr:response regulator transcription factor [Geminicoccaceae bacterium]
MKNLGLLDVPSPADAVLGVTETASRRAAAEADLLLIDGRPLVRECLARALAAEWPSARVAVSGWDRIEDEATAGEVDVCLASVDGAGGGSGAADLKRVRASFPRAGLVVLSDDDRHAAVARAASQGARGYFSTSVDLCVLVQGIRLVLVGGTAMPVAVAAGPERAAAMVREPSPDATVSRFSAGLFTPKEMEVLRSLASGRPNKLIAHELTICETTVKVHLRHIFRKLGTTNRTHAALLAREMLEGADA